MKSLQIQRLTRYRCFFWCGLIIMTVLCGLGIPLWLNVTLAAIGFVFWLWVLISAATDHHSPRAKVVNCAVWLIAWVIFAITVWPGMATNHFLW